MVCCTSPASKQILATEDPEGIKKLRALKIVLTGEEGVRNVQRAFIELDDVRRKYRLLTAENEIIK